ncbi:MAG: DUF599 family protein [Asticcacaulis sp.]|uniref:DUF599 domain-containing protein n=1 Tax=Asticcacaulis sp. TaxID=1872648 RepID=UPI0039E458E5
MSILNTLIHAAQESPLDIAGLVIFVFCWLGYEPFLRRIAKSSGLIARDLSVVRRAWMKEMTVRDIKLFDSNLMAHAVNSATNFSSANLLLIAAVAGVLFGGHLPLKSLTSLGLEVSSTQLFQIKLALVLVCLSRGLLDFIWSLRQMNYCAAAMGSLPENMDEDLAAEFTNAITNILEPAMTSFSQGVRAYYFSLAAAAWLWGPTYLAIASIGAVVLLGWRQSRSQSARGLRRLRELLEAHPYPTAPKPLDPSVQSRKKNIAPHNSQSGY